MWWNTRRSSRTQVQDVHGDELDRADEAFLPHDLTQAGNAREADYIINDDELNAVFAALPQNVVLETILDTCHGGIGLKAVDLLLDRKPRFLPPPSYEAFAKVEGRRSRGLTRAMLEKRIVHHIFWAACRADQTSADAYINGTWHGHLPNSSARNSVRRTTSFRAQSS